MLPEAFTDRMQEMLSAEEYQAFLKSYGEPKKQALRLNPLKGDSGRFLELCPFSLTRVPWEENGYYFDSEDRPGKHPFHEAGVYYIQEASAMAPVPFLAAKPGERILDLCAAPGGKSTQIAAAMQGEGILVCNEYNRKRAEILAENIERMGVANAIVVNHDSAQLSELFPGYFDRILVDAPCSGEGMFRKNEEAVTEWSPENVELCAERQDEILDQAAIMLHDGGRLVYSTCTFAPAEDEGSVQRFLDRHPEFSLLTVEMPEGMEPGRKEWAEGGSDELSKTIRLWPHKLMGEGHFLAVLQKEGYNEKEERPSRYGYATPAREKDYEAYLAFQKEHLRKNREGIPVLFGDQLYLLPKGAPALKGLRVLRAGLHLGTLKKNRFEPGHALALSLKKDEFEPVCDLTVGEGFAEKYLRGETFETKGAPSWNLITIEGYSLGFGKNANGIMKNHYPKGLRKNW